MGAENKGLSCLGFDSGEPFSNSPWQKKRHREKSVKSGLNSRIVSHQSGKC